MGQSYYRDGGAVNATALGDTVLVEDKTHAVAALVIDEITVTPNDPVPLGTVLLSVLVNGTPLRDVYRIAGWQRTQTEGVPVPVNARVPPGGTYAVVAHNSGAGAFSLNAVARGRYEG